MRPAAKRLAHILLSGVLLPGVLLSGLLGLGLAVPGVARAETLRFTCTALDAGWAGPMTLTYAGAADGTLEIAASFGSMALPARLQVKETEDEGQKVKLTGIRAFGAARVQMPAKAALEACLAAKRQAEATDDILSLMTCRTSVALAEADIEADVELFFEGEGPETYVYLKRIYRERSADYLDGSGQPGGFIAIESLPPPECSRIGP